jgi:hypothetical protein
MTSVLSLRAVTMMIGRSPWERSSRQTANPSMPGSIRSSSTTSTVSESSRRSATSPEPASSTS